MKHHIIVKFTDDTPPLETLLPEIKSTFAPTLEIDGVHSIEYKTNIIARANRYDLMIIFDMDESALPVYDECDAHKKWKSDFGKYIAQKAIFDSEE